jgi:phage-related protein
MWIFGIRIACIRYRKGDKMELSKAMKNVLEAIQQQTIKMKGNNKGEIKNRISGDSYYQQTLNALYKRGLIDYKTNTIYGNGYAATKKSLEI